MRRIIAIFAVAACTLPVPRLHAAFDVFGGANFPASVVLAVSGGTAPLDQQDIFAFLETVPNAFENIDLPEPTPFVTEITGGSVNADAGDYLFILYGTPGTADSPGIPGEPPTGNVAVIFFPTAEAYSFTQPNPGFALLYDHVPAPDGGLTLGMLGVGLAGVTVARRLICKQK